MVEAADVTSTYLRKGLAKLTLLTINEKSEQQKQLLIAVNLFPKTTKKP